MLVEKDISRVNIGSYVVKIIKQRGNNNDHFQHGWIRDLKTIEKLIDLGVERVLVDTNKLPPGNHPTTTQAIAKKAYSAPKLLLSFTEQLSQARELFNQAAKVQENLLQEIENGNCLDLTKITPLITGLTEHIYEHGDAHVCILSLRSKDRYHIEHAVAATILILVFSRHMELPKSIAEELALGAFIHDVGKVFIDESILNKAGSLSAEEFEVIKSHVNQSINIVKSTYGIPKLSQQIVAQHHEKLDGSGYPKGFDRRVISDYAQMLAICDIYDAITTSRIYKAKQSQVQAFAVLIEMANDNLLDLKIVNQFIKCLGVYPVGSIVKLNNQHLAIVESRNVKDSLKPNIRLLYNLKQKHFINSVQINLLDEKKLEIERVVDPKEFDLDINKIIEFVILSI